MGKPSIVMNDPAFTPASPRQMTRTRSYGERLTVFFFATVAEAFHDPRAKVEVEVVRVVAQFTATLFIVLSTSFDSLSKVSLSPPASTTTTLFSLLTTSSQ